jgi:hypothetical protein
MAMATEITSYHVLFYGGPDGYVNIYLAAGSGFLSTSKEPVGEEE